jgi:homogentisate 1,2-dioxygenase
MLSHGTESKSRKLHRPLAHLLNTSHSYVPYKYEIEKLVTVVCSMKEQLDPSAYCILQAKSKIQGVSLTEFCAFTPKWLVAFDTIRPPVRPIPFSPVNQTRSNFAG